MPDFILRTEKLSKRYRIISNTGLGWRRNQRILVDDIARIANQLRGREFKEKKVSIWALKDVSFEARQGDVIGIIGRNGAGKSTLLKLLSRVTEPTSGRAVLYGRVGSLLEVGTGFHSELTGRENIFISGAIIGMSRAEIKAKFDEIVAFSGVEAYLDTPVKRFSSGMEVRLAFSVAAHLRPNVLLVDEVLSVGDASFQAKSLLKIKEVADQGGTILFISHNMTTVASLCTQGLVLEHGLVSFPLGPVNEAITHYLAGVHETQKAHMEQSHLRRTPGQVKISAFNLRATDGTLLETLTSGMPVNFEVELETDQFRALKDLHISILIKNLKGDLIANLNTLASVGVLNLPGQKGRVTCHVEKFPLAAGNISITLLLEQGEQVVDRIEEAYIGTIDGSGTLTYKTRSEGRGMVLIEQDWSVQ
jgi:lipopolysaccharide transport system ATP-binding protein